MFVSKNNHCIQQRLFHLSYIFSKLGNDFNETEFINKGNTKRNISPRLKI